MGARHRLPPRWSSAGGRRRLLVDQLRTVDTTFIHGRAVHYLGRDELAAVEHAVTLYLGL